MRRLTFRITTMALALAALPASAAEFSCPKGTKEAGVGQEKDARWCESMVDGKVVLDGPFWRFYPDGKIASKETFSRGDAVGTYEAWHPNGKLARKGSYKKGLAVGTWRNWDDQGRLRSEVAYKLPRATRTEFFPNGKVRARGDMLDGAKVGTWTLRDESGTVVGTCDFGKGLVTLPPGEPCRLIADGVEPKGFARPAAVGAVDADGGFTIRVGGQAWRFATPGGWVADGKAGAADGLPVVLSPRGTEAWRGPATMYVRPVYRDGRDFPGAVAAEGEAFRKSVVDYAERLAGEGKTASGRPWMAKSISYHAAQEAVGGAKIVNDALAHEAVAFVDASDDVVLLLVLASHEEKQVDQALPALRELASSARSAK
ncbi:MAG TPA: hypothetical protein PLL32_00865 [Anaeromyxobacteraceae bacterium]|nr:hypothetical protein [Anaeromyxobacteraceae bacterium]